MTKLNNRMQYRKTPMTLEQVEAAVPAAFAESKHNSRSEKYGFFKTSTVIESLMKEGFAVFMAEQQQSSTKPGHCKHLLRFRHLSDLDNMGETLPSVATETVLVNSHDGSTPWVVYGGLYRKFCDNGLFVGEKTLGHIRIRHSQKLVQDVIDASYEIVNHSTNVLGFVERMQLTHLTPTQQLLFAEQALKVKFGEKNPTIEAGTLLEARRDADKNDDLWTVYNVLQENIIRGGKQGKAATGRQIQTRPIINIRENLRVNQELWNTAIDFLPETE